jgi:hypothetical protein
MFSVFTSGEGRFVYAPASLRGESGENWVSALLELVFSIGVSVFEVLADKRKEYFLNLQINTLRARCLNSTN